MIVGRNVGIMYKAESVYGTDPGSVSTAIGGKVTNFVPTKNNGILNLRGLGDGRNVSKFVYGKFTVSGTINWQIADFTFLQHLIGPLTGTGVNDSDPKILTEANEYSTTGIQSFTMKVNKEDGSSDQEDTYTGCILTECTLTGREDGTIEATASFVAQTITSDTSIGQAFTPYTTSPPFAGYQATVKFDATPTTISKLSNWSTTFRNNAIVYYSVGSRFIEQPIAGARDYLFTLTVRDSQSVLTGITKYFYDDASEAYTPTTAIANAEPTTGLKFSITLAEGALTGDRKTTIQLSEAVITDMSESITLGEDVCMATFNGVAKQGTSNVPIKWVD